MVPGPDQVGLHGHDHAASTRTECLWREPRAVGFEGLGRGLVEELGRVVDGDFVFDDTLHGHVAQLNQGHLVVVLAGGILPNENITGGGAGSRR